jgi:CheY-like chemotaxis protein
MAGRPLRQYAGLDPDVAVLDITMPELDGFRTAQALKKAGASIEGRLSHAA